MSTYRTYDEALANAIESARKAGRPYSICKGLNAFVPRGFTVLPWQPHGSESRGEKVEPTTPHSVATKAILEAKP